MQTKISAALNPRTPHPCSRWTALAFLAVSTLLLKPAAAVLPEPSETLKTASGQNCRVHQDLAYPATSNELRLDVYQPAQDTSGGRAAVLLIHGGGWAFGDKADTRQREAALFAVSEGLVAVSLNYTLTRFAGGNVRAQKLKAAWPNNIFDCKSALRWMKKNAAALGIDPDRIAVWGGSTGGHLALLTGLSARSESLNHGGALTDIDASVRCIIDFFGIPDVREFEVYSLLEESDRYDKQVLALASPIEHLSMDAPPVLVVHGTNDEQVEPSLSEFFVQALKQWKIPHEYVLVNDVGHGFGLTAGTLDLRPMVRAFFKAHLLAPPGQ